MNFKHASGFAAVAILLLAIGFLGGLFFGSGAAPSDASGQPATSDPSRQDLVKQLVSTKAVLQVGLTFTALGSEESHLRAVAELADRRLNDRERKAVTDAIDAIYKTRSAWQEILDKTKCHWYLDMPDALDFGNKCEDDLTTIFASLGISDQFPDPKYWKVVKQNQVITPLLGMCILRIQSAILSLE
jgi:hypothetical protein